MGGEAGFEDFVTKKKKRGSSKGKELTKKKAIIMTKGRELKGLCSSFW